MANCALLVNEGRKEKQLQRKCTGGKEHGNMLPKYNEKFCKPAVFDVGFKKAHGVHQWVLFFLSAS